MDKVIFSTKDIPQADKLEKVIQTVEAVHRGLSTEAEIADAIGFSERQARYYRHAAEILGFIINNKNNAIATDSGTEIGKELTNSDADKRKALIKRAIFQNKLLKEVINQFEKKQDGLTEMDVRDFLLSISDNEAHSTVPRRVKTILSWFEYVEFIIESDDKYKYNPLAFDFEEILSQDVLEYPTNYSKEVDIKEEKFSIYELIRKIKRGTVLMDPDFQRNLVWKPYQKSQFIESIILNVPLPPLYFKKDLEGKYIIVDGLQRTSTIRDFVDNIFYLDGLAALEQLNKKAFNDLDDELKSRIEDKNLLIYILQPSVPMVVVYDIFNRINTGGTSLERQEIRNCIFIGKATMLLKKLSETNEFKVAVDYGISPTRMKDREAILRCLAFKIFNFEANYNDSMDDFLERTMKRINKMNDQEILELEKDFFRVMKLTFVFFGTSNFRLSTEYSRGRINIAIMESVYSFFSKNSDPILLSNMERIRENYKRLFQNDEYLEAVRYSTGSTSKVKKRFSLAAQILGDI